MQNLRNALWILAVSAGAALLAGAQAAKAGPDTIVFTNGDKLAGTFVRSTGTTVTLKSDVLGDLPIEWSKVRELQTAAKVAVIRKAAKFRREQTPLDIPIGTLAVQDQKVEITPAAGSPVQSIPVTDASVVLDEATFQTAAHRSPGICSDWAGSRTLGATLVEATQSNRTLTGAVSLVRAEPTEDWLDPSYRTLIN